MVAQYRHVHYPRRYSDDWGRDETGRVMNHIVKSLGRRSWPPKLAYSSPAQFRPIVMAQK